MSAADITVTRTRVEERSATMDFKPGSVPDLVSEHSLLSASQELLLRYPTGALSFDKRTMAFVINAIGDRCSRIAELLEARQAVQQAIDANKSGEKP